LHWTGPLKREKWGCGDSLGEATAREKRNYDLGIPFCFKRKRKGGLDGVLTQDEEDCSGEGGGDLGKKRGGLYRGGRSKTEQPETGGNISRGNTKWETVV